MKSKLRPIFKDVSVTYIAQAVTLVAFLCIYRLIGKNLGPEGVGEYALARRVVALLSPFLLLGLGMGIPRYIAMSRNKEQRSAYMKVGLVVVIFTLMFLIFMNLLKECFAKIFFGNIEYANLMLPLSFLLAGVILHGLVYSYFRGRLFVNTFNLLQVINLALVPLIILVLFKNITIDKLITLNGITTVIISLFFSSFFAKEFFIRIKILELKNSSKNLLRYSLPRIPSSLALSGFFSLGPIFAAHFASIEEAGYLSVSQTLLTIVGTTIAPLGVILLPKISSMIIQKRDEEIKENLNYLIGASIQISIFVSFQLIIFADAIIKYWLGSEFLDAIPVMRIASCSIFFYLFYRTVGSVLDASKIKPINTINLFISLGIFLTSSGILLFIIRLFSPIISLSIAFLSGLIFLGILSYISIRKIYPEKLSKDLKYFLIAIGINMIIGGIAISAKSFMLSRFYYLIMFEILIGIVYLLILWSLRMDWLRKLPEKILLKTL